MRAIIFFALALALVGCGKNEGFSYRGGYPYQGGYGPQLPTPPQFMPPRGPVNPQIPQGYPQQFAPFAPMYNYMQQNQQMQMYWQQLWQQWQMVAMQRQIYVYSFQPFWDYCQYQMNPYPYGQSMYNWFDVNVYVGGSCGGYCY